VAAGRGPELAHEAGHQIKKQLMVTVDLELVDYGSLPRSERKSQRVFDSRIQDEIV
jgi:phenylacetate-coenzyme A ligase PaaK-like adenylate-forming protein